MRSFAGIDRNARVLVRTRGKLLKLPGKTALFYHAQFFNGGRLSWLCEKDYRYKNARQPRSEE